MPLSYIKTSRQGISYHLLSPRSYFLSKKIHSDRKNFPAFHFSPSSKYFQSFLLRSFSFTIHKLERPYHPQFREFHQTILHVHSQTHDLQESVKKKLISWTILRTNSSFNVHTLISPNKTCIFERILEDRKKFGFLKRLNGKFVRTGANFPTFHFSPKTWHFRIGTNQENRASSSSPRLIPCR